MDSPSTGRRAVGRALWSSVVVGATALTAYLAVSVWWPSSVPRLTVDSFLAHNHPEAPEPVNPFESAHGVNLVAYLVTASDCGWSQLLDQNESVAAILDGLRSTHAAAFAKVSVVGVAIDMELAPGLSHLATIAEGNLPGVFDQIAVGGSWLNEQIVRLHWRERTIEAAIPQILVVERPISTASYLVDYEIAIQTDRVVANPRGIYDIVKWMQDGYPLEPPLQSRLMADDGVAGIVNNDVSDELRQ